MKKVLVAGATGYLGQYVTRAFKNKGYYVKALARSSHKLDQIKDYIDEKVIAEITRPDTLEGICDGVDIVFSSIGITKQKDKLTFNDVDYRGNGNLLKEAQKSGVKKFIFISVFNAHKMSHLKAIQAKLMFEKRLRGSDLDFTIIYPNGFYSDMLEYLNMAKKGRGYLFGSGENKINPIHGEDLAEVCVSAAESDQNEIEVGGPDILTHNEILQLAFSVLDKKPKISHIPLGLSMLFLKLLRLFTSVKTYGPVEFFMTVLTSDLIAPQHGRHHLKDFFEANKEPL